MHERRFGVGTLPLFPRHRVPAAAVLRERVVTCQQRVPVIREEEND